MSRLLSSDFTVVYKFILPAWLGLITLALILGDALGIGSFTTSLPVGLGVLALGGLQLLPAVALKRVEMDSRNLYISNFRKQIVVPLAEVAVVSENRWLHFHPVTIRFVRPTDFGSKISFAPDMSNTWFTFLSHPVVDDLRTAVARAHTQAAE